jgi:diguanylate cyclase
MIDLDRYAGPVWWTVAQVRGAAGVRGGRRIVLAWLAVSLLAIGSALLEAALDWSGIPVQVGGFSFGITLYPPLILCLLLAVWLGPAWGIVPAYLSTLASALYSGLPWHVSLLFAAATPVEVLIVWGSMVILNIQPEVRRWRDFASLLMVALIASTASSLAGLIWIDARNLDILAGERIWQGWLVGDFVQIGLVLPLVLRLGGERARGWIDARLGVPPRHTVSYTRGVALVGAIVVMLAALVFQGVDMIIDSLGIPEAARTAGGEPLFLRLREILWFLALLLAVATITTTVFATALARIGERERNMSLRDVLTGCLNRRAFDGIFQKEADRSQRLGLGISLIFFDVDHFKRLNDGFGHETGDEVLRLLARRVQGVVREHDVVFRWGGEEFVVLLPHTAPGDAVQMAERIRVAVADEPLLRDGLPSPITVTLSLCTAGTDRFPVQRNDLIGRADAACYVAKRCGRNRVEAAVMVTPAPSETRESVEI